MSLLHSGNVIKDMVWCKVEQTFVASGWVWWIAPIDGRFTLFVIVDLFGWLTGRNGRLLIYQQQNNLAEPGAATAVSAVGMSA